MVSLVIFLDRILRDNRNSLLPEMEEGLSAKE